VEGGNGPKDLEIWIATTIHSLSAARAEVDLAYMESPVLLRHIAQTF
jgi:hypothetical protein